MTQKQFEQKMEYLKRMAISIFKTATPVRTGYQKANIYAKDLPNGGFEIIVDTPYAEYTTQPWKDGLNPNEGWADEAAKDFKNKARIILRSNKRSDR